MDNLFIDILKKVIIVFFAFFILGCNEDDEPELLFEDTPTQRLNDEVEELRTLLQSSENGWKAVYYTDDSQLGGFTFVFKFIDGENVEMTSDFDDDTSLMTSKYDVILGSTIKLSFSTKNDIHKLSDGLNPPDGEFRGRGYLGDFEFLYYGMDNGDIIFRTNRDQKELRFNRASSTDVTDISLNREILNSTRFNSVYSTLEIMRNGSLSRFTPEFNFNRRTLVINQVNSENQLRFVYAATKTGITIRPPLDVGGQSVSEFVYDADENQFIANLTGDNSAIISFFNQPSVLTNDNLLVTSGPNGYGYIDEFLSGTSSPAFVVSRDELNIGLRQIGFEITRVQFLFNGSADPDDMDPNHANAIEYRLENLEDRSEVVQVLHYVTYDISKQGILILNSTGEWTIPDNLIPLFEPIDTILTDPEGLYVKQEDFTVRFGNTIFSFTGVTRPNFRMVTYAFQ